MDNEQKPQAEPQQPPGGGSYDVQPDGSLVRRTEPTQPGPEPVKTE